MKFISVALMAFPAECLFSKFSERKIIISVDRSTNTLCISFSCVFFSVIQALLLQVHLAKKYKKPQQIVLLFWKFMAA